VARDWEVLSSANSSSSFSDFTPAGESVLYTGDFYEYVFPTTGNPDGVFNSLASAPGSINSYTAFAWYGGYLYTAQSSSIYRYNIAGNNWTTMQSGLDLADTQSTADDSGYVYAETSDGNYLLKYDTSLNTVQYIDTPTTLPASEPRAAWDSQTQRVYLADYCYTYLYAFNPQDNSFTPLAPFPNSNGVSDAFCSDRRGHIYTTSGSDGSLTDVWMYTAATDSWAQIKSLPFEPGNSAVCTVSADGYLYIGDGSTQFARLKVF
jgi:streptogramin lyase